MASISDTVSFSTLCELLEKVENQSRSAKGPKRKDPKRRKEYFQKFFTDWRQWQSTTVGLSPDDSIFPAMRLLLPSFDKERGPYGLKEHLLAKKLIEILCLDKNSPDALRLLNYRAPSHIASADIIGDFGSVAMTVMKNREILKPSDRGLSIKDVNDCLDGLALSHANKDKDEFNRCLLKLLKNMTSRDMKWLCRILLKQMKLGMSEKTVFQLYHQDAESLYDVSNDLQKVCKELKDPSIRLDQIQIQLFTPFRPMLANRTPPNKVPEIMGNQTFFIENKYDGERVQLHKDGDSYRYFSRNGNDFTSSYGANASESGTLTTSIHSLFNGAVKSIILDGEMVGWYTTAQCIATKGEHFDVRNLHEGDEIQPCLVLFDCVMINGEVMTGLPLSDRLEKLETVVKPQKGRLMLADRLEATTERDVIDALNMAIEGREEGIVIKRPSSTYQMNVRSNQGGWLKIKPDYIDHLMDDLDLLIIGGYYGEGHRGGLMSHFLLALAVANESGSNGQPERFKTFCKVGSGYSNAQLYQLNLKLKSHISPKAKPSESVEYASEKPDVWIDPKNSYIVQIRAAEITSSRSFAVGFTLRFPRVEKFRDDKSWFDCMTTAEFETLRTESAGKLAQAKVTASDEDSGSPPKKRRTVARTVKRTIPSLYAHTDTSNIEATSDLFKGKEFCLFVESRRYSKRDLEIKIKELGGSTVANPTEQTFCVVATGEILKVKTIIKQQMWNVVKDTWLFKCLEEKLLLPWTPKDMWFATKDTQKQFEQTFDEFGDSFTEETTVDQLKQILLDDSLMKNIPKLSNDEIAELEAEYFPDHKYGLFRPFRFYLGDCVQLNDPTTKIRNSPLEIVALDIRLYRGTIVPSVDLCSHVVLDSSCLELMPELELWNRQSTKKLSIVTEQWVVDCIAKGKLLTEREYYPVVKTNDLQT